MYYQNQMAAYVELERPVLSVVSTASEVEAITADAFKIAEAAAEKGYSYISGTDEFRRFNASIPEEFLELFADFGIRKKHVYGTQIVRATFQVINLEDNGVMSLTFRRENAPVLKLGDPFSQGVLDYFRNYFEQRGILACK